ncbi:MAG: methionine adenosyltransferase [Betaproteobacteria bacterium AqS2]|uniref:methionine adenosyltransferase n=1 Tax=Candidatus Amphirhobacter heronislandensis TaxID=1732024 RepID=A0A930UH77_9GAMM|nr:methionine adenosyltransferase [Betaproteobacteria bacterium AqS2]
MKDYLFTSESVSDGHPDKLADQISDAVLDEALKRAGADAAKVRCACETLVKGAELVVAGELTPALPAARIKELAAEVLARIGYDDASLGFAAAAWKHHDFMSLQAAEIGEAVNKEEDGGELGAGDQGLMFGYACDETPELMPLALSLSHALMRRHKEVRAGLDLRPDAKSQVTVEYAAGVPKSVAKVVLSTQHAASLDQAQVRKAVEEQIIKPVSFVKGGPMEDAGLTGRKIIVDTYGGSAPHGGGAFSGKDPTKVDRSAAYMARYVAKTVVRHGLARRCLVQLSYAIGRRDSLSVMVNAYDDGAGVGCAVQEAVRERLDLSVKGIIDKFALFHPAGWSYGAAAAFGHFGRAEFPWENPVAGCAFDEWCQERAAG